MNQDITPEALLDQLATAEEKGDLAFLVIGGHAVNAYGYTRTTLDFDFLIAADQLPKIRALLEANGYRWAGQTATFAKMQPPLTDPPSLPADLMLVSGDTFAKLREGCRRMPFGDRLLPVPAPLHLIALKLHAMRNPERRAAGRDLSDILGLVSMCQINPHSRDFCTILDRYADAATRHILLEQLG